MSTAERMQEIKHRRPGFGITLIASKDSDVLRAVWRARDGSQASLEAKMSKETYADPVKREAVKGKLLDECAKRIDAEDATVEPKKTAAKKRAR